MSSDSKMQIAIIGAGLAGLVLALSLHKRNISPTVYESRPESYIHGGSIALTPNALRVLYKLGVYEELRAQGFSYENFVLLNQTGVELGHLRNGSYRDYNFPALRIKRTILRDLLLRETRKAGIPVHWQKTCTGIVSETAATTQHQGLATAQFSDGSTATASFVIAADGIHSRIRPFVALKDEPVTFSGMFGIDGSVHIRQLGSGHATLPPMPCMMFSCDGIFAVLPTSPDGDDIGFFANFECENQDRGYWEALGKDPERMRTMMQHRVSNRKWPEAIRSMCTSAPANSLESWPFYSVPRLSSWTSPSKRVILIGDAAHGMPPTGGQGAAMAFEDAETLSTVLSHAFMISTCDDDRLESLLQKWENHRLSRLDAVLAFTSKGGAVRKATSSWIEQSIKEWIIWLVFKFKGAKGGMEWLYMYDTEDVLKDIAQ